MAELVDEKIVVARDEYDGDHSRRTGSKAEEIRKIDAIATAPGVSRADFAHINEKKLLRRMDWHLLPTLTALYLLSFIDRGNIGNAKIEGLAEDLHLTPGQYNWCLTAFFFTYCAFEPPSNVILKKIRPSIWLPAIMVAWGTVMTLMGLVQSYAGLLTARIFLGITEAGLFPGVSFYLSMWYTRYEYQWRFSLFFSAVAIAGAFSGLLAYGISFMNGIAGQEGWRWIFILEGIATVLVAGVAFFTVYDFPETAKFLSPEERAFVVYRLKYQSQKSEDQVGSHVAETAKLSWKDVKHAFTDWQVWVGVWMFWGIVAPLYGIALFLPTIIKDLGYRSTEAQLLTVPIYVFAAMCAVGFAWLSDRVGKRTIFIIPLQFVILVGFIMCISSGKPGIVYAGIFIAAAGVYGSYPGNIALISNNLAGSAKRAVGMAIHIAGGNLSGAMASNFYRQADAPRYTLGHALEIGFVIAGIMASSFLAFNYNRLNRKKARKLAAGEHNKYTHEELSEMGDRAITFKYML
ncbi:uncharacterized protein PV09_00311 [Verruconis gallopava]|uniref:Major facilitator superfamily (MFS) profile domain-containing protein n=1 Tax=Verruconis gallopava TaxID=253628 RepID=A0A0D2ASC6_9PEZI|nr:uncharacterized protein PV09_00311 [Verruconis gallopava]KIW09425.1 hypothetical protein PV09_00311 [Verruconis gallopava]